MRWQNLMSPSRLQCVHLLTLALLALLAEGGADLPRRAENSAARSSAQHERGLPPPTRYADVSAQKRAAPPGVPASSPTRPKLMSRAR